MELIVRWIPGRCNARMSNERVAHIEVDEAMMHRILHAQLDHVHSMTEHDTWMKGSQGTRDDGSTWDTPGYDPLTNPRHISDDGYDYLSSALELAQSLLAAWYDGHYDEVSAWLNDELPEGQPTTTGLQPGRILYNYACDGVAPYIYSILCKANLDED